MMVMMMANMPSLNASNRAEFMMPPGASTSRSQLDARPLPVACCTQAPRCIARTRRGSPCQSPAYNGFEHDPEEAARVRVRLLRELAANRESLVATHLSFPSVCHVAVAGDVFRWVPGPWEY